MKIRQYSTVNCFFCGKKCEPENGTAVRMRRPGRRYDVWGCAECAVIKDLVENE